MKNDGDDPRRVVIFRNRLRAGVNPGYGQRAGEIYELARRMPGFVASKDFIAEDGERLAVIEFAGAAELAAWRDDPEHRKAQGEGRERFYSAYQLQVCKLLRESLFVAPPETIADAATPPAIVEGEGGCACGAVRYRVGGAPRDETWCHCTDCRRASGAPAVAWATFNAGAVDWIAGTRKRRRSSEHAQRGFCADCGTQLTFERDATPQELDLTLATLDAPELVTPQDHIFVRSQIGWDTHADGLPRFAERRPLNSGG
jgi:heme-degrading monooxygenase HmoA